MARIKNAGTMSACLLGVMVQIAPAAADPAGWGTNLENDAEFVYRSVYQRSLEVAPKRAAPRPAAAAKPVAAPRTASPNPRHVEPPQPTASALPDLPVRNPRAVEAPAAPAAEVAGHREASPVTGDGQSGDPRTVAATSSPTPLTTAAVDGPDASAPDADPWNEPVFARAARNTDDVLVTGVLGAEEQGEARDRTPRDRGDQYCTNIATAATDARFAWQKQTLRDTEEQLKKRIDELQGQIADYKKWLARRDEFSARAQTAVTSIYSKMAPDAAAQQLTVLDEETAAAVLAQLKPQVASAVMAEMEANRAARLTAIISASSKGPKGKLPANPKDRGT
jgi:flagellar motility protein MotE (MotC chaperone)